MAGLDQAHPLDGTAGEAVAEKLMLLPQPDEIAFHVAILLMMGNGWTVTFTVYILPSEAVTLKVIVPVVAGLVFKLNVCVTELEAVDCGVPPFTLLGVPVMVHVKVVPAVRVPKPVERSLVAPEQKSLTVIVVCPFTSSTNSTNIKDSRL
jgi:hypothetical protein